MLYALFFIGEYILACVLLPAKVLSTLIQADGVLINNSGDNHRKASFNVMWLPLQTVLLMVFMQ
jgi:hypothetical protein